MKKRLISIILMLLLVTSSASVFAEDYWRYSVEYADSDWKECETTTNSTRAWDGTNIITGLNATKTYFDVAQETYGSATDDESLHTVSYNTKLGGDATNPSVAEGTTMINISDKSVSEVDGVISYTFDFKPLNHIDKQNNKILAVRMSSNGVLYNYALLVKGLTKSQTKGGSAAVNIGLGNLDSGSYTSAVTSGKVNDWQPCNIWYRYYVTADKNTSTITVGVKRLDTGAIVSEYVESNVAADKMPSTTTIHGGIYTDAASFELRDYSNITYSFVNDTYSSYFNVTNGTSCKDTYLKLTPKSDYTDNGGNYSNYLNIISGGNRPTQTSGVIDYSMLFKVKGTTDQVSNKVLLTSRMGNSLTWNYALKVVGLSEAQKKNSVNIGLGGIDSENANFQTKKNSWTDANAWYKYHISINYYTKTVTVGVTNMSTGAEVFEPYTATFDPAKYAGVDTKVTTTVKRYGAEYGFDEVIETRDIFLYKDITVDDTADGKITASVMFANDVHSKAYKPAYNGTGREPVVIVATYDSEGRLLDVNSGKPTIDRTKMAENDSLTWSTFSVDVKKDADYNYCKVLLWKELDGDITPFSASWTNKAE